MQLSFDEAGSFLDDAADGFPPVLFEGLNGGINLLEDTVPDPAFPEGELYILGEYCEDMMGKYINLYFGSFTALAEKEDWDRQTWETELRTTLSHELTHHMESRGGLHGLDDRDTEELAAWKREYGLDR
ncbi:metallopeptidase family protein [Oscillibacter sp.]|uniref:metallopeptidase family protein n=1 Tax=Oscillibacter sp. TaxID=1945593 RepID=UPI002610BF3C|nr:metallopeptidase family protein [Oscillibacter sp.]MDD3346223.1 metallopeptidase family protein [Oscillibacter sp.]